MSATIFSEKISREIELAPVEKTEVESGALSSPLIFSSEAERYGLEVDNNRDNIPARSVQTGKGEIKGGEIRITFANSMLDGLKEYICNDVSAGANRMIKYDMLREIYLIKYADDFIVTGDSNETLVKVKSI